MGSYSFFAERPLEQYRKSDTGFLISVILLLGLGLFTLYFCSQSAAYRLKGDSFYFVKRQFVCAIVGIVGFIFLAMAPVDFIRKILPVIWVATIFLCVLTLIPGLGIEKNGARRWLRLPMGFTLQASEIVKFTLIMYLANFFDKQSSISVIEERNVGKGVFNLVMFCGLVIAEKDFSTTVFIFVFCCIFFAICGMKCKWMIFVGFLAVVLGIYFVLSEEYRLERIISFLNPTEGLHDGNYQAMASKRAISAGGFWGAGIGTSLVQSNRIPEVQADYIFASWAEAMGLVGIIVYFCILGFFAWKGFKISLSCKDRFAAYTSLGFVAMIVCQSLVNCGVVCGGLPSTGIPLPFFSLGGSSIIVTLCMCGFVINASRLNSDEDIKESTESVVKNINESEYIDLSSI
ncbi:MAG: cell division protein FtsW [Treponema sp.]|nr:cell division protein FtsW [Treponema sp.]